MPTVLPHVCASLILSLGMAGLAAPVRAEPVTLMAVKPCAKWLDERKPRTVRWGQTWLLGFLSGYSLSAEDNFLAGQDPDALFAWMDGYCKAHPQADIADGGQELIAELKRERARRL